MRKRFHFIQLQEVDHTFFGQNFILAFKHSRVDAHVPRGVKEPAACGNRDPTLTFKSSLRSLHGDRRLMSKQRVRDGPLATGECSGRELVNDTHRAWRTQSHRCSAFWMQSAHYSRKHDLVCTDGTLGRRGSVHPPLTPLEAISYMNLKLSAPYLKPLNSFPPF